MAPKTETKAGNRLSILYDKTGFAPHIKNIQENLKAEFPDLDVKTDAYPLTTSNQALVTLIFVLQVAMTLAFMFASQIVDYFKLPIDPEHLKYFEQNKFMVVPAMLMLSPVRQLISKTGAFEIYLNDERIWSTLTSRVVPNYSALKSAIEKKGVKPTKK
ncbi:Aste57867_1887 [Aphanomyces stellatus]|uniref:Aste57867_1887 protein n=1 Tax=Aphanomyces stellatus TaxID=120398 RepID=A0A485K7A7_9STRA|nr:hypothetical protein As57867_001885 [Aphanomyces stellatus]VFT79094.1 Aste57867_1887 [Aphanomyces stellatus]